jgi:hypothetical protein
MARRRSDETNAAADDPIWPCRESPDGRHDMIAAPPAQGGGRVCWYCGKQFAMRTRRQANRRAQQRKADTP